MANKTLGTRQKLVFRLDPAQSKPRNPVAALAKRGGAGSHQKNAAALRQAQKQALKKLPIDTEQD
ncbi:hypothetical protein [Undibacterium baiyunense]|jgi:hypothetical protein|uniref:Uncharacterized protein n=1 Tax=Undibacterium baiyunense TaxID=2828731 RepID=A0A941DGB2_9BURK|nr:hypothetical protein [Undibacterium baiyunense]MBR7745737.1 hypothetical protein [Undibacterium baiyunense]